MSTESALSYAALILADSDIEVSPENLQQLTSKANIQFESIWYEVYAKALEGKDLKNLFFNLESFAAAAAAPAAGAPAGIEQGEAKEDKKKEEEEKEESDEDMGMGLFD